MKRWMRLLASFFLFILSTESACGQSALDSAQLHGKWKDSSRADTAQLNALGKLIENFYLLSNADETDRLLEEYQAGSLRAGAFEQYADALTLKGIRAYLRSDVATSRIYFRRVLAIYQRTGDIKGLGSVWNNLAVISVELGQYRQALMAFRNSQRFSARARDFLGFSTARSNLCEIYASLGYPQLAEQILRMLIETDRQKIELGTLASAHTLLGNLLSDQNRPAEALIHYLEALGLAEEERDHAQQASLWSNITTVHREMKQFDLADQASKKAIEHFVEIEDSTGISIALVGQAATLAMSGDTAGAMRCFHQALSKGYAQNDPWNYALAMISYSRLLAITGRIDSAEFCLGLVRPQIESSHSKDHKAKFALVESIIIRKQGRGEQALGLVRQARKWASEVDNRSTALDSYLEEYRILKSLGRDREALETFELYSHLNAELLLEDKRLEVFGNALKYDYEKQAIADSLSLAALEERRVLEQTNQRQRQTGLLVLMAFLSGFALVFWVQRNQISRERKRSDDLLENILPADVAEELKNRGSVEAREFSGVAVLFTDFSGFTAWSSGRPAAEVVREIDECFGFFDTLIDRYRLEKIKTIGDGYMAASGLKSGQIDSREIAENAILAAFEMLKWVAERALEKELRRESSFGMRVGIHFGPAVAGVVGSKKFQYDLWGDTVNTASRMESCGEQGRLNVSESVRRLFEDHASFRFIERNPMEVKGKGLMRMYWVEVAHSVEALRAVETSDSKHA